jgi:hypothetical protein
VAPLAEERDALIKDEEVLETLCDVGRNGKEFTLTTAV